MNLVEIRTGRMWHPPQGEQKTFDLVFRPVYGETPENKAFFESTPNGVLEVCMVNSEAAKLLVEHRNAQGGFGEFYVDITPA